MSASDGDSYTERTDICSSVHDTWSMKCNHRASGCLMLKSRNEVPSAACLLASAASAKSSVITRFDHAFIESKIEADVQVAEGSNSTSTSSTKRQYM